jgi:large-conductance mechanosensitive channel
MDSIIGSVFFEFIGAMTKWILYAVIYKIKGKNIISFKEMWEGPKRSQKSDILMHGFSNTILGLIVVVGFIVFLIKFI